MDAYGDPIPPGHGEHESASTSGAGSNVYTDTEWAAAQHERHAIRQSLDTPTAWGEDIEF